VLRDQKGLIWGVVGEYRPAVRKALKLPEYTAGFEIDPTIGFQPTSHSQYAQLPRFPRLEQDICLRVPVGTTYQQVFDLASIQLKEVAPNQTRYTLSPVDIYQREDDAEHKQITLRLSIASYERTLTDDEVNDMLSHIADKAKAELQAERV
jgi:phenylalanyl-tRNA synthetase beta subunit